ncbi:hypothetical protein [Hymenobacter coccineus]|uniref:Uncharacterized protein n=1 Tax=Hymenobacter coccineus TaxID=1908235 RepID=A0A1G1TH26_9BACT|nr:hypothetical protein [Hymenobacter coccineus]OGX90165.1 hypothetical protein BEN49_07355 [Hymenobacter coccineus]
MSSANNRSPASALLAPAPTPAAKNKPGPPKPAKQGVVEEKKDKKHPFTSTITEDNKRQLAQYQAHKPGGARTTDVLNQALKRFFDANKQYAGVGLGEKS